MENVCRAKTHTSPIVSAAIRHRITGEVTLGEDHFRARVAAFRIATKWRPLEELIANDDAEFFTYIRENEFDDIFVDDMLQEFDRATATQIVNYATLDADDTSMDVTMRHSKTIREMQENISAKKRGYLCRRLGPQNQRG